jgi:hypothetical protein
MAGGILKDDDDELGFWGYGFQQHFIGGFGSGPTTMIAGGASRWGAHHRFSLLSTDTPLASYVPSSHLSLLFPRPPATTPPPSSIPLSPTTTQPLHHLIFSLVDAHRACIEHVMADARRVRQLIRLGGDARHIGRWIRPKEVTR